MSPYKPPVKRASRSARGAFDATDEAGAYRSLVNELTTRDPAELAQLRQRYAEAVDEPERRAAVERLLGRITSVSPAVAAESLPLLAEFLYFAADQRTLAKHGLIFPAYDILDEYDSNKKGPWGPLTAARPTTARRWRVFDHLIDFPIGIGACPLTANSRWIAFWAAMGYNLITYKSVRSRKRDPYPERPHWVLLRDVREPFVPGAEPDAVRAEADDWCRPGDPAISSANSFGIPSDDPAVWQADLQLALQAVYTNQLLVVSVLGDLYEDDPHTAEQLATDFVNVARLAYEAGARVIELNLSCPNLLDNSEVQPPLCRDTELAAYIVQKVFADLPNDAQLVAKLSYLELPILRRLLVEVGGLLRGVTAINTLQVPVVRRDAEDPRLASDTFPGRRRAGVSGIAIRDHAYQFAADLVRLRSELDLSVDIVAMGGVTCPDSFAALKSLGVDAVQSVTGVFGNPLLASESIEMFRADLGRFQPVEEAESMAHAVSSTEFAARRLTRERVVNALESLGKATSYDIAAAVGVRVGRTAQALDELKRSGAIAAVAHRGDTYYHLVSTS